MKAGERITVWANQGERPAIVLAVLGDVHLAEYTMPSGSTALRIIHGDDFHKVRRIGYWDVSRKWLQAIVDQDQEWEGRPQQAGRRQVPTVAERLDLKKRLADAKTPADKLMIATGTR